MRHIYSAKASLVRNAKWALRRHKCRVMNLWPLILIGLPMFVVRLPTKELAFIWFIIAGRNYNALQRALKHAVRYVLAKRGYAIYVVRNINQIMFIINKNK